MTYKQILLDVSDKMATITLNRPERLNAWTPAMAAEIIDALNKVDEDDGVMVSILTGAGRGFCAGMDLSTGGSTFASSAQDGSGQDGSGQDGSGQDGSGQKRGEAAIPTGSIIKSLLDLKKPVIVAVNGPAVGVGVTMILPMDIRIAAQSARRSEEHTSELQSH